MRLSPRHARRPNGARKHKCGHARERLRRPLRCARPFVLPAAAQIVAEIYKFRAHVGEYDQLAIALADTSLSIAETAGLPRQRFVQVRACVPAPASTD